MMQQFKLYYRQMSEREGSEQNYRSSPSANNTDRPRTNSEQQEPPQRLLQSDRQLHQDSPTRHDVDFYVRKVNRYEGEIARLEHELSVCRFKLSKSEDYEQKYELLFKENQNTIADEQQAREELDRIRRELDRTRLDYDQQSEVLRGVRGELEGEKKAKEEVHKKKQELRSQTSSQGQEQRQQLKEWYGKELANLKDHHQDIQNKLNNDITELKN